MGCITICRISMGSIFSNKHRLGQAVWRIVLFVALSNMGYAKPLSDAEIALVAENAMSQFDVPGMAIGILKGGEVVHLKGYGIRELGNEALVDSKTMFKVASNTKAFTTAALAILVDEGKISWQTKVVDVIPEFRLSDSWVTSNLNVLDLLTHRSGMNQGAGDLMLWPEPNNFTRADIIYGLRYFELVKQFRAEYAYDNLLYIVAGELIPRLTNMQWREFVDARIMQPLNLHNCFAGAMSPAAKMNLAAPHGLVNGKLAVIERSRINDAVSNMAAAGAIKCSAEDMTVWMKTLLRRGEMAGSARLYSEEQATQMWTSHIPRGVGSFEREWGNTHFSGYGLGWRTSDVYGYKQVSHTGSLAGFRSFMTLVPELELGVVVLTNGSSSMARKAVMYNLIRSYMTDEDVDWTGELVKSQKAYESSSSPEPELEFKPLDKKTVDEVVGSYEDPWFGEIELFRRGGKLLLRSIMSPILVGELKYLGDSEFVVQWFDRTLEADAFVRFYKNASGIISGAKMEAVSSETDFSFDFHDLSFKPVKER
jgi:CubicO group peptidase (beta-lactamase class C family)